MSAGDLHSKVTGSSAAPPLIHGPAPRLNPKNAGKSKVTSVPTFRPDD